MSLGLEWAIDTGVIKNDNPIYTPEDPDISSDNSLGLRASYD